MDRINALGDQDYKPDYFTKELLAETHDDELQKIVKKAAKELHSPIALVSLVMDHIQFFKAHVGLPKTLAEARGTHRDASFCQFVVRDGTTFEVTDGANDPRIPQHVVKEFNIQAYLGVPIKVSDQVVGSLCVLDTKKREFSTKEHESLEKLSVLVNKRLEELTRNRRTTRLDLAYRTLNPAVSEMTNFLQDIQNRINECHSHLTGIQSFLKVWNNSNGKDSNNSETVEMSYQAALSSHNELQEHLLEMEMNVLNSLDGLNALNSLTSIQEKVRISEIVTAAQDLTRNTTKAIGGFPLPDFVSDPYVYTKSDFAIALISNALLILSAELQNDDQKGGIHLKVNEHEDKIELVFFAKNLKQVYIEAIAEQLNQIISSQHPTVGINTRDRDLIINLRTIIDLESNNNS